MNEEILRKVQLTQLEIAKEIKRVCDEYNIEYFLTYGTLLGAVRHKGFIPWDDDMDLGMTRKEYNRFLRIAPEALGRDFFLQTWDREKGYGLPFAKVRKNNTHYVEKIAQDCQCHCGIYVDVFPYDEFPDDDQERKKLMRKLSSLKALVKFKCGYRLGAVNRRFSLKWWGYWGIRTAGALIPKRFLVKRHDSLTSTYNGTGCTYSYVGENASTYTCTQRTNLENLCELPYEDTTFKAPAAYDAILTDYYGDYMVPPPEDKRESTHGIGRVEFE